jgi:hypothetical protein
MTILFDVLLGIARETGMLRDGVVDSGSTTTIVDAAERNEEDDIFNGGTVFLSYDAGGAAAAPENESKVVSDFAQSSNTITFDALSSAVAAGDLYGVMNKRYPRWLMIQKINESLRDMNSIGAVDTSVTTATTTREYSIPKLAKYGLRQLWIAQKTTAPWHWRELRTGWRQELTAAGNSAGVLIFHDQPAAAYKLKMVYVLQHGDLRLDSDYISEYIPLPLLVHDALFRVYRWRLNKVGYGNLKAIEKVNEQGIRNGLIRREFPVRKPKKRAKLWSEIPIAT